MLQYTFTSSLWCAIYELQSQLNIGIGRTLDDNVNSSEKATLKLMVSDVIMTSLKVS